MSPHNHQLDAIALVRSELGLPIDQTILVDMFYEITKTHAADFAVILDKDREQMAGDQ
jgi:hypothetical protein